MPVPVLEKYGKSRLRVTDISQQFWCERQVELSLEFPREETPETIAGSDIHRELMHEIIEEIEAVPETVEDEAYLLLLNIDTGLEQLLSGGKTRELRVFGKAGGFPISGTIDEISISGNRTFVLDHKTRRTPRMPSPAAIKTTQVQVMLYRKMLQDLKDGIYAYDDLITDLKLPVPGEISPGFIKELGSGGVKVDCMSVEEICGRVFDRFRRIPELSDSMIIRYIYQGTKEHIGDKIIEYDPVSLESKIAYAGLFWEGKRKAFRVKQSERWKCSYCEYNDGRCVE
ncbi:hypothetical protein CUJ83_08905 [Methanocella sp. CWC-04]|uniref:PD-(D/E)XK endonuclease-like domain-containing protein n=1 Tax=Methanooceanicella nereidis TaxID=2052831 RepID=A0AAP2REK9_9EURY|nr:PD-(D/E)XK nuclease family protein [Methanocella sp. CWC-04]MCD1295115.1 hypothetical protein [Methanocella sp. CWC-04]